MWIKAEDLIAVLKKMDEVDERARVAASAFDRENWQSVIERLQELRSVIYEVLAKEEQALPAAPLYYPQQRGEPHIITCKCQTGEVE